VWHELLSIEIAREFQPPNGLLYDRVCEAIWRRLQGASRRWTDHGKWWRRSYGRKYARNYQRERASLLKKVVVAIRGCTACGRPFEVSAYREQRGRVRVCSVECRGGARRNIATVDIDGTKKSLSAWAKEFELPLATVWARIKRGWDIKKALQTPKANRGHAGQVIPCSKRSVN
jgi:hypothetical protein